MRIKLKQVNDDFRLDIIRVESLEDLKETKKFIDVILNKWPEWMAKGKASPMISTHSVVV